MEFKLVFFVAKVLEGLRLLVDCTVEYVFSMCSY